jgi:hypothetical protein
MKFAPQREELKGILPKLSKLCLSDTVVPLWPFLRALPDPTLELVVSTGKDSDLQDEWTPYHVDALAHVKQLWHRKTGFR